MTNELKSLAARRRASKKLKHLAQQSTETDEDGEEEEEEDEEEEEEEYNEGGEGADLDQVVDEGDTKRGGKGPEAKNCRPKSDQHSRQPLGLESLKISLKISI